MLKRFFMNFYGAYLFLIPLIVHFGSVFGASEAPVTYLNREVVTLRDTFVGIAPAERARRAQVRINELLDHPGEHTVSQKKEAFGTLLLIDGSTAFVVTEKDTDPLQPESVDAIAGRAAIALEMVIAESRKSRDLDFMLRAGVWSALATALLIVVLWGVAHGQGWIQRKLVALTQLHARKIELGGLKLLQRERIVGFVQQLLAVLYWGFALILLHRWLSFVLGQFPITQPWAEMLDDFLWDSLTSLVKAVVAAVPGLFTAIIIFLLARALSRALDGFFERVRSGQIKVGWLDADVVTPTQRIAKTVIWLFALAMSYPYLPGAQTEAFKGLSVLLGLMVSLGASNLVGQAASGLILTYGRVFRKGEFVHIAGHEGTVMELGVFATRIRTGLGEELTISNSSILGTTTKNYSRAVEGKGFVLDTTVTIGYDTPWRQVHALLSQAALQTEGVQADPAPHVYQTALTDWYPQYRLVCQALPSGPQQRAQILSDLLANIQDVFHAKGIQIMSPHYMMDPAVSKLPPTDLQQERPPVSRYAD
jgi:small-conductance mechanosensitive channel